MSLEEEFNKIVQEKSVLIDAKLKQANMLLKEAIDIAEENGIPFYSNVSHISQTYTPESFASKWGELDSEVFDELGIYPGEYGGGWDHSAVC